MQNAQMNETELRTRASNYKKLHDCRIRYNVSVLWFQIKKYVTYRPNLLKQNLGTSIQFIFNKKCVDMRENIAWYWTIVRHVAFHMHVFGGK